MWQNGLIEWVEGDTAFLSVVFSWQLQKAYQRAVWYKSAGYHVRAGGPAVTLNPEFMADVAQGGGDVPALHRHNPDATFTSRGCVNKCLFCAVPTLEGALVELEDWPVRPIICDNNLTACSTAHFDRVIDRLLEHNVKGVDFNQGLDARLLTEHHAARIAELHRAGLLAVARLAWDHSSLETQFRRAHGILSNAGIPADKIRVYCLIGFDDTPEDALYRLETVRSLGSLPNPMRYQPLCATRRNEYVGGHWSNRNLTRYMRYWSRLQFWQRVNISFDEFENPPNTGMKADAATRLTAKAQSFLNILDIGAAAQPC